MVKAIWAVACSAAVAGLLAMMAGGCGSAPVRNDGTGSAEGAGALSSAEGRNALKPLAGAGGGTSAPEYRMGPEDVLRISVWDNKDLTLDLTVRPDGKISLPLIQDIQAEGLTAAELADLIHQRLLAYIKEPQVSVVVLQVNSSKFYIVGEVSKPGTYLLRGDVSVLQALSMAGGFTTFASPKKIRIVRNTGGKQEMRVVNYYDMIDRGGEGNYLLRPADTIVVP